MTLVWNTGSAAARFRLNRKKIDENRKRNKAASLKSLDTSLKPQATSLKPKATSDKLLDLCPLKKF